MYEFFQDHPDRARRWANAMSQFASRIPLEPLYNGFDWVRINSIGTCASSLLVKSRLR